MFLDSDFTKAITSVLEQLQSVQAALKVIKCPPIATTSFKLPDLSQNSIEKVINVVPTGYRKEDKGVDYIYVIQVSDKQCDVMEKLCKQLDEARKVHQDKKDYPRLNGEHLKTSTLYVGRSKTLRSRLRQHLGENSKGVYSLHLQRWATSINVHISIFIMKFSKAENLLVQAIEDGLWSSLKPAFGRKGER